jgi:hypothetical protein
LFASILLFAASGAEAGTLTAATWSQSDFGFSLDRSGAQLGITGSSTATSIAVSLSFPQTTVGFFVPKTPNGVLDLHVTITQGGPQALTATPGMGGATMGVPGTVVVMTAVHNSKGVNQSTFMTGINTLVQIPLNVGVAGQATRTFLVTGQQHFMTVDFYAWTPGTSTFTGLTSGGAALPSVVAMGSFNLTALGGGTVTLVSPTKISIDGALSQRRTVSLTTLEMYFVPEPSTLLLLAAAGAALALRRDRAIGESK